MSKIKPAIPNIIGTYPRLPSTPGAPENGQALRWNNATPAFEFFTPAAGPYAPTNARYLVLLADATLTDERVFTPGAMLLATDDGAGGHYHLAFGSAGDERGDLVTYQAGGWAPLHHGNAGALLQSGGHGADPSWFALGAEGRVLAVDSAGTAKEWAERHRYHGFPTDSSGNYAFTVAHNAGTRVFTITPTGASYTYWINGHERTQVGAVSTAAHAATDGPWYLYYDAGTGNLTVSSTPWELSQHPAICDVPIAIAILDTTTGPDQGFLLDERHQCYRSLAHHDQMHDCFGALREPSGGVFSGYVPDSDAIADVTWAFSSVTCHDEDLELASAAVPDGGPYIIYYRTGVAGTWTWTMVRTLPWEATGGHAAYNAVSAGSWGLIDAVGSSVRYICYWVYWINAYTSSQRIILIPGQYIYSTLAAARAETPASLALGSMPSPEMVPVGKVILKTKDSYAVATEHVKIQEAIQWFPAGGAASISGTAATHPSLSGLSWSTGTPSSGHTGTAGSVAIFDSGGAADEAIAGAGLYPLLSTGAGASPAFGQMSHALAITAGSLAWTSSGHTLTAYSLAVSGAAGAAAEVTPGNRETVALHRGTLQSATGTLLLSGRRVGTWRGRSGGAMAGSPDASASGTAMTAYDADGCWVGRETSGAGATAQAYLYTTDVETRGDWGPVLRGRSKTDGTATNVTYWMLLIASAGGLPTSVATTTEHAGFYATNGGNWYATSSDGAVQQTTDLGVAVAASQISEWEIDQTAITSVTMRIKISGTWYTATHATRYPGTTLMGWHYGARNTAANVRSLKSSLITLESA